MSDPVKITLKRVMLAALGSGSGKTVITCALLKLMSDAGMDVTSYKCGPDYIDPMFHKRVLGITGGNLDTFFSGHEGVRDILSGCESEYAVIEGVMGVYDGIGGLSVEGSSYDVAEATDTPVILIVDAYGVGRTIISAIRGILHDDRSHLIRGIILNRIGRSFYERLAPLLNEAAAEYGACVMGFIPRIPELLIDSRHLGLMRPDEIAGLSRMIEQLAATLMDSCDIEAIKSIMEQAADKPCRKGDMSVKAGSAVGRCKKRVRLAVAYDEAFCFYYKENIRLFEDAGADIVYFSPIHDTALPPDVDGIYIGGGYPELYLKELCENISMKESVKMAIEEEIPSIAECGGFMYLCDGIAGEDGARYPMIGAVHGECAKGSCLGRFGYVTMEYDGDDDNAMARSLSGMKGHEFHYYDCTDNGEDMRLVKAGDERSWRSMHIGRSHVWGYAHMYLPSKPSFADYFVGVMQDGR